CLFCERKHISESEKCDVLAMLDDLGLSNLEQFWLWLGLCACAGPPRIPNGNRTLMVVCHPPKHNHKTRFIFPLHMDYVWDMPQTADVEETVMRWSVVA